MAAADWDALFDGRVWKLTRGVDYRCDDARMADYARRAARRRGVRVAVCQNRNQGTVYLQRLEPLEVPPGQMERRDCRRKSPV
jgi:hypothetical protein